MMNWKKTAQVTTLMLLIVGGMFQTAASQDFGAIMKELDRIEASLAATVAANAKKQETAIAELRKQQTPVANDSLLQALVQRLDSLQQVVE